jgi:hypothetical protein
VATEPPHVARVVLILGSVELLLLTGLALHVSSVASRRYTHARPGAPLPLWQSAAFEWSQLCAAAVLLALFWRGSRSSAAAVYAADNDAEPLATSTALTSRIGRGEFFLSKLRVQSQRTSLPEAPRGSLASVASGPVTRLSIRIAPPEPLPLPAPQPAWQPQQLDDSSRPQAQDDGEEEARLRRQLSLLAAKSASN